MKKWMLFFLLAFSLLACDKKDSGEKGDEKKEAVEQKDLGELFPGSAPTLPAFAKDLNYTMDKDAARKVAPDLIDAEFEEMKLTAYGKKSFATAVFWSFSHELKNFRGLKMGLPAEALDAAKKSWGEPLTVTTERMNIMEDKKETLTRYFWFNPAEGVYAYGEVKGPPREGLEVFVGRYLALDAFLGEAKATLGFESTPILGAKVEDLEKAYGAKFTKRTQESITGENEVIGKLILPPIELDTDDIGVEVRFKEGAAIGYELFFEAPTPEILERVHTKLETQRGAPTPHKFYKDLVLFPGEPQIGLRGADGRVKIYVGEVNMAL